MFRLLLIIVLWLFPSLAHSQDVFDLFGYGPGYKSSAGAGLIASRGAAANYYNPANLIRSSKSQIDVSVDVMRIEYTYTYPQYLPINIRRTVPVPFFGWSSQANKRFAYGFSLIPMPESSSEQKLDGLPTRQLSNDPNSSSRPIIVDVNQKGSGGFGYKMSLGMAMKLAGGFNIGLSVLADKSGSESTIIDDESQNTAAVLTSKASSTQVIMGSRGAVMGGKLIAMTQIKLPKQTTRKGNTSLPVFGDVSSDTSGKSKGPLVVGVGFELKAQNFYPYIALKHERWSALKGEKGFVGVNEASFDYFDANSLVLGSGYRWGSHRGRIGFGQFQSYLGDGIMASESAENEELIGMQFQDIHAIPHTRLAAAYEKLLESGSIETGLAWIKGDRDVWDKARGYGNYKLNIYQIIFGGAAKF